MIRTHEIKNLTVEYKGKGITLNPRFIDQQGIDKEGIEKLKEIHFERMQIEDEMENTDDPVLLHELAKKRENAEFKLQEAWGFPQDANYHRWWEVPKCICPKMDNEDNYGTEYRIIRDDCPVHSTSSKKKGFFERVWNFLKKIFSHISFGVIALIFVMTSCQSGETVLPKSEYTVVDTLRTSKMDLSILWDMKLL